MFKFTEEYIQRILDGFFKQNSQKYTLENLYVFDWESDKLIETRSGLIYEYEIKVSRSDYKNDFKNKKDKHVILEGKERLLPSYDIRKENYDKFGPVNEKRFLVENRKKPNYFYYAVPEGMIDVSEVPDYAGLIYVLPEETNKTKDGIYCWEGFYIAKKAPKLHDKRYTDEELNFTEKFYYNMLSWKEKCRSEKDRRLVTEEHKIPYAELFEKYTKLKKENAALKTLVDTEAQKTDFFSKTLDDDMQIMREYRKKLKELIPDFNVIEFEDKILEEYDDEK